MKLPGKPSAERQPSLEDMPDKASRIARLTFEDNEKAADKLTLEVINYDLKFPDDPIFDRGNVLVVQWGYAGNLSPERECTITNWIPGITFKVEALASNAVAMNRIPVDYTWYGRRPSDVVKEIAAKNGFSPATTFVEETPFSCESIVQGNRTDAQFLRQLALKYGKVFFVDASGFHWHSRALGQQPKREFKYFGDGSGDILEFPSFEAAPAAQPGSVTLKAKDPKTGQPLTATGDDKSTAGRPGLAPEREVIDTRTSQTVLRPGAGRDAVALTGATSQAELQARADGLFKKAAGVPVKCTVPLMGDPLFVAKTTFKMSGIGQRLSGGYYAQQVTHSVESGKYTMSVKAVRDGTNGTPGASQAKSSATPNTGATGDPNKTGAVDVIDTRTSQTKTQFRDGGGPKK